jgi:hypothetical protein
MITELGNEVLVAELQRTKGTCLQGFVVDP